jgi:type I restriction enzyme S subunit
VIRHAVGDIPGLSKSHITDHWIGLPPAEEQQLIVAAIESHFSRLDAAAATLERVQRNLERYRASVLKAAVEGRLVPTEAELAKKECRSYEPAPVLLKRILAERRRRWEEAELARLNAKGKQPTDDRWKARYPEPAAPDTDGLPALPEGWCWATLGQLLTHLTSGSRDWTDYYDRGTGVFLMAQNVRPGRLDLSFIQHVDPPAADASRARSQVEEGDLLVTIVGANTGDVCRVPRHLPEHYVCQSVALMRPVLRSLSHHLDAYLNSPPGQAVFDRFMYGQGRPHLGFDQLTTTPVPLPPLDEARRIVTQADDKLSVAAAIATPIGANTARIARLRQSILKWAFEGRLVESSASMQAPRAAGSA